MKDENPPGNGLAGRVLTAADLLDYQEGAVVSRTVVEKESGTVTLFAFDEGQGLSEHTSPYDAVVYILDGKADIAIGGDTKEVREGEMLIMPAKVPHSLHATERFKMLLIMIRGQ